ncbi:MAG: alkylhydroperoxidase [Desulfobulbaceae bacterium DB1]|nr:MAG: alkylhydroperoxidase [Desulfobulbaceae bacterium DB1]
MSDQKRPKHHTNLSKHFPEIFSALDNLGTTVRGAGPLDRKTSELIQLGAAAAVQSEGSVHSHTRRALEAGADRKEIQHTLLLLISTIGFPRVAAAMSWAEDVLEKP